jgi:pimeloyl-ACP methyl ester carboxylesterase
MDPRRELVTQNILYIHGAYGSSTIFSRMVDDLPDHHAVLADYDCLTGSVDDIVSNLKCITSDSFDGEPYSVIAHSLGGIVALGLLASGEPVERIFTMSTPFGGNRSAGVLFIAFWHTPVLADVSLFGNTVRGLLKSEINIPVRSVVSTGGYSRQVSEANDGVITVASQTTLEGPDYHRVACTHFGVLLADPVIDLASDFLFQNSSTSGASSPLELVI